MASKYALITGCTAGSIGYFLAREFASHGYHVFATARRVSNMGDLGSGSKDNNNITILTLDITSTESIASLHEAIRQRCTSGKLDVLFHNAGYRSLSMAIETSFAESIQMLSTNVAGTIELNRVFTDMVIAAKGSIVFTSSLSGLMPQPAQSVYCASKAALDLYARTLRIEMRPFAVSVTVVHTGGVKTSMTGTVLELENESRYQYLATKINKTWSDLENDFMEPDKFAKEVVGKVIQGTSTDIWSGKSSFLVRILEFFNLGWAYDGVFAKMFGLNAKTP